MRSQTLGGLRVPAPLAGLACPPGLEIGSAHGGGTATGPLTPGQRKPVVLAYAYGCLLGSAPIATTGAGEGGAFDLPPGLFGSRPVGHGFATFGLPKSLPGRPLQLATSFAITGPRAARTRPAAGSMAASDPPADFRRFRRDAWSTQTGRAGAGFTWCPGPGACPGASAGPRGAVVKYLPGANRFGGTMGLVWSQGGLVSNLAVQVPPSGVRFQVLNELGSRPTGRGYADRIVDPPVPGQVFAMYTQKAGGPVSPMTYLGPFPGVSYTATGFPFTTGTVIVRQAGNQKSPFTTTLTGMGGDAVTSLGARNLTLVAGSVAYNPASVSRVNRLGITHFLLPEPGAGWLQLGGVLALLGAFARRGARGV